MPIVYCADMRNRILIWCALLSAAGLTASPPASGQDGRAALQAACWQPAALAARPGENIPVRLHRPQSMRVANAPAPAAPIPAASTGVIRRVALPPGKRLIALTFDLCQTTGETAGYDGAIVDYLRSQRVKATFFAGGRWMLSHAVRTEQLLSDPLFEVGTHGWAHRNTRRLTGPGLIREITAPVAAYASIRAAFHREQCAAPHAAAFSVIPEQPHLFRFPFGACNAASRQAAADAGLVAIQWDFATGDPSPGQSARAIAAAILRNTRPGSIIIMHANGRGHHTAQALPMAIPALRAKGFQFATISELIAAGEPVFAQSCYNAHPGDIDKYDFLFSRKPPVTSPWITTSTHARTAPALPH